MPRLSQSRTPPGSSGNIQAGASFTSEYCRISRLRNSIDSTGPGAPGALAWYRKGRRTKQRVHNASPCHSDSGGRGLSSPNAQVSYSYMVSAIFERRLAILCPSLDTVLCMITHKYFAHARQQRQGLAGRPMRPQLGREQTRGFVDWPGHSGSYRVYMYREVQHCYFPRG